MRKIDIQNELNKIYSFVQSAVKNAGYQKVILGLSGGIDSSLAAALCGNALGNQNVIGIMMPYKNSNPLSLQHAKLIANTFKITYEIITITNMVDAYFDEFEPEANMLRRGNRMARERMCILYDLSAKYKALVVGTSNKSEIYAGYCTQYGDSACAFEPFAHLYKSEVREIAVMLNIPAEIINKPPTADLWEGQTDEKEMGISYPLLDEILFYLIDEKMEKTEIMKKGFSEEMVDLVLKKIEKSEFKRKLPLTLELGVGS